MVPVTGHTGIAYLLVRWAMRLAGGFRCAWLRGLSAGGPRSLAAVRAATRPGQSFCDMDCVSHYSSVRETQSRVCKAHSGRSGDV